MTGVLNWLQITALSYLATALLFPQGSAILPWWLCGVMVALCYGVNYFLSSANVQGYLYIVTNALSWLLFCVIPIVFYEYWSNTLVSQTIVPGIFIFFMAWFSLVNSFLKPQTERTKVMLWEIGIIASTCGMFLSLRYDLNIPYATLIPLVIISSGLLNLGLKKREESAGVIRTHDISNHNTLATLFLLLAGTISLFMVLALALQQVLGDSGKVFLTKVVDWFKSLAKPVEKKANPLLDYVLNLSGQQTTAIAEIGSGTAAPLWLLYTLWAIIALMLFVILVWLIMKLRASIHSLKTIQQLKPEPFAKQDFASVFKTLWEFSRRFYNFIRKWFWLFKEVAANFLGIPPSSMQGLFSYYLWWGNHIGLKKHIHETPREYLGRLGKVFEENYPELLAGLSQLTLAHEKKCYGGSEQSLSPQEIKKLFSILVGHKRLKKEIKKQDPKPSILF